MSESALQEMVYSISHDFGRPLRQIVAFTDLLTEKHASELDEESAEWLDYLSRAGKEAQHMLERLLVYSRMQGRAVQPVEVDLTALVNDCLATMTSRGVDPCRDVEIDNNVHGDIHIDRELLYNALLELLDNAMSYGGPGRITLSVNSQADLLSIKVTDSGDGIPEDKIATALRAFGRLRPEEPGHVGLGLNIAQRAAQSLGGDLSLQQSPGAFSATITAAI